MPQGPLVRVTLAQYLRLSPEDRTKVTHIDASIADDSEQGPLMGELLTDQDLEAKEREQDYPSGFNP